MKLMVLADEKKLYCYGMTRGASIILFFTFTKYRFHIRTLLVREYFLIFNNQDA